MCYQCIANEIFSEINVRAKIILQEKVAQPQVKLGFKNSPSIDGFLHIPEMNLFILSHLMPEIDIHSIGGKQGDYEALWHAVPSKECVINALQMKSFLKLMSEQRSYCRKKLHNLKLSSACRGLLHEESRPLTVGVYMVKKYCTFN